MFWKDGLLKMDIEELYNKEHRPEDEKLGNYTGMPTYIQEVLGPPVLQDKILNANTEIKIN